MRRKYNPRRGWRRYALRMERLEPVFGQAKQGRGFRQLLVQNLEKGNSERFLFWTGHNLLKVFFLRCRMTGRGWLAKSPMIQPWHRQYRVHPPP